MSETLRPMGCKAPTILSAVKGKTAYMAPELFAAREATREARLTRDA